MTLFRNVFFISCFLALTINVHAQEPEKDILKTPDTWRKEFIEFPLSFAPTIDFVGVEDIRFSSGWGDSESEEFWMYAFVWYLDQDPKLSVEKLNNVMRVYFDGIMNLVADSTDSVTPASASFTRTTSGYQGTIKTYDAFFAKKEMTLHVQVEDVPCSKTGKFVSLFKLSLQPPSDPLWSKFDEVKLNIHCDD